MHLALFAFPSANRLCAYPSRSSTVVWKCPRSRDNKISTWGSRGDPRTQPRGFGSHLACSARTATAVAASCHERTIPRTRRPPRRHVVFAAPLGPTARAAVSISLVTRSLAHTRTAAEVLSTTSRPRFRSRLAPWDARASTAASFQRSCRRGRGSRFRVAASVLQTTSALTAWCPAGSPASCSGPRRRR